MTKTRKKQKGSQKTKEFGIRALQIILPVFSTLFILAVTGIGVLLASGYSINLHKRSLEKTGVVNVLTTPSGAFIWLNKEPYGKTNRALPNVKVGDYLLELYKDGYYPFRLNIKVEHGLATLVHTYLVKETDPVLVYKVSKNNASVLWYKNADKMFILANNGKLLHNALLDAKKTEDQNLKTNKNNTKEIDDKDSTFNADDWYIFAIKSAPKFISREPFSFVDPIKLKIDLHKNETIKDFMVSPNGRYVLVFTNKNRVLLGRLERLSNDQVVFKEDTFLSSHFADDVKVRFLNSVYVVIVEPNKRLMAYNLDKGNKVLLYEDINKGQPFVFDVLGDYVLIVDKEYVKVFNQEGVVVEQFNFAELPVLQSGEKQDKNTNSDKKDSSKQTDENKKTYEALQVSNAFLLKTGKDLEIALVYKDKVVILGKHLIRGSSKTLREDNVDEFEKYGIVPLINSKQHEVVGFVFKVAGVNRVMPHKDKDEVVLQTNKDLIIYTYNKDEPDVMAQIGAKVLYSGNKIKDTEFALDNSYLIVQDENSIKLVSVLGENVYKISNNIDIKDFLLHKDGKQVLLVGTDLDSEKAVETTKGSKDNYMDDMVSIFIRDLE